MPEEAVLEISFDINTIDHLGVKLYSTIPPMIAELVANAWDADAKNVDVLLKDDGSKSIVVKDDGHGMNFDELNNSFLKIGRNRREETNVSYTSGGRAVLGKKGLGKLSVFGIGKIVTVTTIKDGLKNQFRMKYEEMKTTQGGKYHPEILFYNVTSSENSGTEIKLEDIRRSSNFDEDKIVDSLSQRFTLYSDDFKVNVKRNNDDAILVGNNNFLETHHQFKWEFPKDFTRDEIGDASYSFAVEKNISGTIYTSQTPLRLDKRGVVLFSRGKLVQERSSFHDRGNDNFFQYMAGIISVDFIDQDKKIDFISTDRKSVAWDSENNQDLMSIQTVLKQIIKVSQKKWREKRSVVRREEIKRAGIDLNGWLSELTSYEKPLAEKLGKAIIENDKIEHEEVTSYLCHIKDMFSFQSFRNFAAQLDELEVLGEEKAIKLLTDWQLIEAKEMAKIAEGRLKTINQFEKYIDQNASETKVMQKFLEDFPWLLDPKMTTFEREVTYTKWLKEKFPDNDLPESNRRIDFLCSNSAGTIHIIELKRPGIKLTFKEIHQAASYLEFLKEHCPNTVTAIHAFLISNRVEMDSATESMAESFRKDGKVFIKSYDELLSQARGYHKEFIKKYDELKGPQNV